MSEKRLRLPGVEPGSIAWKAIILTVGLQTLIVYNIKIYLITKLTLGYAMLVLCTSTKLEYAYYIWLLL